MIPLRLVLDTNIVVSAALRPDGLPRTVLLLAITKPARLYVTAPIMDEYRTALARPELQIRRGLQHQLLQLIRGHSHMVRSARALHVTPDPGDNQFLECSEGRLPGDRQCAPFSEVLEENQSDYRARVHQHRDTASDSMK